MSITEFLLARIAEDEVHVRDGENSLEVAYVEGYGDYALMGGERLRAECQAKRAILRLHPEEPRYVEERDLTDLEPRTVYVGTDIPYELKHLASVYADHPDYDRAWQV